jgi:hypothetical protein
MNRSPVTPGSFPTFVAISPFSFMQKIEIIETYNCLDINIDNKADFFRK